MPPNNIVQDIRTIAKTQLISNIPKCWLHQFDFGLQAYSLKPFQPAGSNPRSVVSNPNTAATKTERLLANTKLAERLGSIFDNLVLVKPI